MVKNLEIFCILFHIEKLFHTKRKKRTIMAMTVRRLIRILYKYYQDYVHAKLVLWWNAVKRAKTFWCAVISKHKSCHISLFLYNNIGNKGFQSTHGDRVMQQKLLINNRKKVQWNAKELLNFKTKNNKISRVGDGVEHQYPISQRAITAVTERIKLVHVYWHVK